MFEILNNTLAVTINVGITEQTPNTSTFVRRGGGGGGEGTDGDKESVGERGLWREGRKGWRGG